MGNFLLRCVRSREATTNLKVSIKEIQILVESKHTTKNGSQSVATKHQRLRLVVAKLVETCKSAIRHIEEDEYRSKGDRAMSDELMAAIRMAESETTKRSADL
jgi:hypothetical protein